MGFTKLAANLFSDIGKIPQAYGKAWEATKSLGGIFEKGKEWGGAWGVKSAFLGALSWDEKRGFFSNMFTKEPGSKLAFSSMVGGTIGGVGLAAWGATKAFSDSEEDSLQHIHNLLAKRRS
jgi:hypothetical protein